MMHHSDLFALFWLHLMHSLIIKLIDGANLDSNLSDFVLGAGTEH